MTYQEAADFLFPLHRFGMQPGLERIQALCKTLGNPERKLRHVVHIAGTNGKGSTAAFIASMCKEAGETIGLYTSPHLTDFSERIKINGTPISHADLALQVERLKPVIESTGATFFEATTAIAFKYFADKQVTCAVIETGMGGRLDATNIVQPQFAVITPIGLDHQEYLGDTIAKIATEKAGIIKPNAKTFFAAQDLDAMEVLVRTARSVKARAFIAPSLGRIDLAPSPLGELRFHLHTDFRSYYGLSSPLWAAYQAENIRLAVMVAESMRYDEAIIRQGIRNVILNTGHRARLEIVSQKPRIIVDVSHNAHGAAASVQSLMNYRAELGNVKIVFGAMADKDIRGIVKELGKLNAEFFVAAPAIERAMTAAEIAAIIRELGFPVKEFESLISAYQAAKQSLTETDTMLITGSFYVAGELLTAVKSD
jgi:dihydrofolate synthase / folylpolyglutamate synthase